MTRLQINLDRFLNNGSHTTHSVLPLNRNLDVYRLKRGAGVSLRSLNSDRLKLKETPHTRGKCCNEVDTHL